MNLGGGGFPIPASAGAPVAGSGLVGGLDLGLKLRLHEEGARTPGIAFSYDLVDFFGGFAGVVVAPPLVLPGAGGVNVAFNLFALVAQKHFFASGTAVSLGGYYARSNQAIGARGLLVTPFGSDGASKDLRFSGATFFLGVDQHVWRPFSLVAEWFPGTFSGAGLANAAVRTALRPSWVFGPFDSSAIQFKLDVGFVGLYGVDTAATKTKFLPLPWAGAGLYWL